MFVDVDNCKNENRKLVVHETELSVLVGPIFPTVKNQSNYQIKSGLPGIPLYERTCMDDSSTLHTALSL